MNIPEKGFYFDAENHRYYLDGRQMTGVTTILGVLAKPQLIQWAANEAVEYVRNHYSAGCEIESLLEEARTAHLRKRDKSADIGTRAHEWISRYIKGERPEEAQELKIITDNFLKWIEEAKPRFLASEKVVYSLERFYAGTLDFVAEINGKIFLGDIKTGNGIYKPMFFQTSGYQLALEECEPERKIDGHIIVNASKKGELKTEEFYDYDSGKEGFLACLKLYRLINNQQL